jgi:hypothetical protein
MPLFFSSHFHLPVPAHAGSELASVFESSLREKKATKSPDGVTLE